MTKVLLIFYSHVERTFLTVGKKNLKAEGPLLLPIALIYLWKLYPEAFRTSAAGEQVVVGRGRFGLACT